MRSPLDALEGRWDHAVFTSFSVSLQFFETYVLPLLTQAGVRNVVVLADRAQLGEALAYPTVHRAGTAYHVAGVSVGHGAFHPKVALLASSAASRLVVSSGNLTVSGQMRNLEVAAVLQSTEPNHVNAVVDAAVFLNRLTEYVPSHVAQAISAATASTIDLERQLDTADAVRFIHNLDTRLIDALPTGDLTVAVPYTDANGVTAEVLARDRSVEVLVDADRFSAGDEFFDGAFTVTPITVERPLHGKAYWDARVAAMGSPNLSTAALRGMAQAGNTEVMLVLPISDPLAPPHTSFDGDVRTEATQRACYEAAEAEVAEASVHAFDAWEDETGIHVDLPDGVVVDRPARVGWTRLGHIANGQVVPDDVGAATPRLLRASIGGVEWMGIVHRVTELRIRRHARKTSGAAATLTGSAPLDPESQRLLKGVLEEFLALTTLLADPGVAATAPAEAAPTMQEPGPTVRLSDWRPAHPGDDPNVPALYRTSWSSNPDELLALVRQALRLDDDHSNLDVRADLNDIDLDDLASDDRDIDDNDSEAPPPVTSRTVLSRYRGSFMRLLDRGLAAIVNAPSEDLRDLVFQVLIEQTERLAITVMVRGSDDSEETDQLVPLEDLDRFRLDALDAYLTHTAVPDPTCIHTARFHLARCLAAEGRWSPLDWERIENITLQHAEDLSRTNREPEMPLLGMDSAIVDAYLDPYVGRGTWSHIEDAVGELLEDVTVHEMPVPVVMGSAWFNPFTHSAAWEALGTVAYLGFSDAQPFALRVTNLDDSNPWGAQTFVVEPATDRLYEVLDNRNSGYRMMRYYTPVTRGILERAGHLGPLSLSDTHRQSIDSLPGDVAGTVELSHK